MSQTVSFKQLVNVTHIQWKKNKHRLFVRRELS